MTQRARVLVTYGWCRTAYVAVRALARRGHDVFTCDSKAPAMCAWSRFTRAGAKVADPFTAPEAFSNDVAGLVKKWRIDVVLPGHEDGLVLRRWQHLLPSDVILACPDRATFETAVDKAEFARVALDAGLRVPRTRFPSSLDEAVAAARDVGFPVVVKVRRSNSGKGVRVAGSEASLREVLEGPFRRFSEKPERFPILQELVAGDVVGSCFLAQDGELLALFQERYLRCKNGTFGTSTYRVPMDSEGVGGDLSAHGAGAALYGHRPPRPDHVFRGLRADPAGDEPASVGRPQPRLGQRLRLSVCGGGASVGRGRPGALLLPAREGAGQPVDHGRGDLGGERLQKR